MSKLITNSLYENNTLDAFWRLVKPIDDAVWKKAIEISLKELDLPFQSHDDLLSWAFGEESYGNQNWRLPFTKQVYYLCKPIIPQWVSKVLRRIHCSLNERTAQDFDNWPIDHRLVGYYWSVIKNVLLLLDVSELEMIHFWPDKKQNAFVLTHDIESAEGQSFAEELANIDESHGFHSAFFFIPHRYKLDWDLIQSLQERGFEVGIHGYNHDGKLFCHFLCSSEKIEKINHFADQINAKSFRAPMTLRDPQKMQSLHTPYDLSFFDTDPFEPLPGGTMSIFPFQMGCLTELPYTLVQDYTLFELLQECSSDLWLKKVQYLRKYHGLILLDSHPDYLRLDKNQKVYNDFLSIMQEQSDFLWHALPRDLGYWWYQRGLGEFAFEDNHATISHIRLDHNTQTVSLVL